jgi:tetratricopeptide (TPR) repeat protein
MFEALLMTVDSYAPCPCGSGKKVKFCCQAILTEMEKVERLLENNQPRMALSTLEKILPEHGSNAWVATAYGWALVADHRPADAKAALGQFLRKNPDHPSANALHAMAAFQAEGFPASKKAVHRAFRRSFRAEPSIVAGLAASIGEWQLRQGHVLASRQHFALALRYGDEEDRKAAFNEMVEIDGDASIPYPLRGVHNVPKFQGSAETMDAVGKADRLSAVGCWEEAAELIKPAVDAQPASPEGWHTLGLYQAWDGNDDAASKALHEAAVRYTDFELAVECETLSQLLGGMPPEDAINLGSISYTVDSVSRLLTKLDERPRVARTPDALLQMGGLAGILAAQYDLLDRDIPTGDALKSMTLDTVPQVIGRVLVINGVSDGPNPTPARAMVSALEGEELTATRTLFESEAGDAIGIGQVEPIDATSESRMSRERLPLRERFYIPFGSPAALREKIETEWQTKLVESVWPNLAQTALGGKSPVQARGSAELRVPLAAAINIFDAVCDSRSRMLSVNELRAKYDLPPLELTDLPAESNVNLLSLTQLRRVNLRSLSDEQFRPLLRRVLLSRHNQHAYETLREYLEHRTQLQQATPREREESLEALVDICRRTLRRAEALEWTQRGQSLAAASDKPFELSLAWKMKEFAVRMEDPEDPQLKPLFEELWTRFGTKIPQLRENLLKMAAYVGLEPPGQGVVIAETGMVGSQAGMSLEPASSAGGEKKLWLPGMD